MAPGKVCLIVVKKHLLDGKNETFFTLGIDGAMRPQHSHQYLSPYFLVKISLTYKTGLPIVQPCRSNVLSNKIYLLF
jgi:hypothetical protein